MQSLFISRGLVESGLWIVEKELPMSSRPAHIIRVLLLGYTEGVADIGASKINFLDNWLEQSRHGALNLIRQLVDDGVKASVNLLLVGQFLRFTFRANIEADDDGIRCRGEQHIGLGNSAHTAEQNLDLDPVV